MIYRKSAEEKAAAAKKLADASRKPPTTLVRLARTRKARITRRERYVGELAALRSVDLAPKAAGRIVRLTKELGHRVRAGELLGLIDDLEIVKQIEEAKAAVEVARAQVERAQAELVRNENELNRKKPLFDQQLITRQEMDNLESAVAVAKAALELSKAQVTQAQTRIGTLQVQLENTRLVAPFAGRINRRYVDPGAMVTTMTPVYQLVTADKILARFKVPERDLRELPQGKEVRVSVEAYPNETFAGKVIRVSPAVDAATRTAMAEAQISTFGGKLKPGMFARVDVLWSVAEDVVLAPQRALVRPPDDPQARVGVFVHDKGTARFVAVRPGTEVQDEVEVKGIDPDLEVIVEGQHGLKDGSLVSVAPPPPAPAVPAPAQPAPPAAAKPAPPAAAKPAPPKG
jgi:RND family efflux transporter MFP subunit